MLVTPTLNLQVADDWHIATKIEHDTKAMTKCTGLIARQTDKGIAFLKSDCLKKQISLGCNHKCCDKVQQTTEIMYDIEKKIDGIMGQPVTAKWAMSW
jgi:hypothetical protein